MRRHVEIPGAAVATAVALVLLLVTACSSATTQGGPGEGVLSTSPPTSEPIFSRQLEDPVDDRVTPTAPAVQTTAPAPRTPVVHVLGRIVAVSDTSPDWQADMGPITDDVATIATLACDLLSDEQCVPTSVATWASGAIELLNVATDEAGNGGADLIGAIDEIRSQDIEVVGWGTDQASAVSGLTVQRNDATISIHGISLTVDPELAATDDRSGIAGPDAFDALIAEVDQRREEGAAVVVLVDTGDLDDRAPTDEHIAQIQRLVDVGADAIVGHGSDYLQRFDRVANSAVAYSLGNAVTPTAEPLRTDGAVLRLEFANPGRACLLPATASESGPALDDPSASDCEG